MPFGVYEFSDAVVVFARICFLNPPALYSPPHRLLLRNCKSPGGALSENVSLSLPVGRSTSNVSAFHPRDPFLLQFHVTITICSRSLSWSHPPPWRLSECLLAMIAQTGEITKDGVHCPCYEMRWGINSNYNLRSILVTWIYYVLLFVTPVRHI